MEQGIYKLTENTHTDKRNSVFLSYNGVSRNNCNKYLLLTGAEKAKKMNYKQHPITIEALQRANNALSQNNKMLSRQNESLRQNVEELSHTNETLTHENNFLLHDNEVLKKDNRALQQMRYNLYVGGHSHQNTEECSTQTNIEVVQEKNYVAPDKENATISQDIQDAKEGFKSFSDVASRVEDSVEEKVDATCLSKEALQKDIQRLQKILQEEEDITEDLSLTISERENVLCSEIEETQMLKAFTEVLNEQYNKDLEEQFEMNSVLRATIKDLEEECRRERFLKYEAMNLNIFKSDSESEEEKEKVEGECEKDREHNLPKQAEHTICTEVADPGETLQKKPKKPSRWNRFMRFFTKKSKSKSHRNEDMCAEHGESENMMENTIEGAVKVCFSIISIDGSYYVIPKICGNRRPPLPKEWRTDN